MTRPLLGSSGSFPGTLHCFRQFPGTPGEANESALGKQGDGLTTGYMVYHSTGFMQAKGGWDRNHNWPDILEQMVDYLNGCQTNNRMAVISVISKGWWVQCQVSLTDGGPAILDYKT